MTDLTNTDFKNINELLGDIRFLEVVPKLYGDRIPDLLEFRRILVEILGEETVKQVYKDNNYEIKAILDFFLKGSASPLSPPGGITSGSVSKSESAQPTATPKESQNYTDSINEPKDGREEAQKHSDLISN